MRLLTELLARQGAVGLNYGIDSFLLIRGKPIRISCRPAIHLKFTTMKFENIKYNRAVGPSLNLLIKQWFFIPS